MMLRILCAEKITFSYVNSNGCGTKHFMNSYLHKMYSKTSMTEDYENTLKCVAFSENF